MSDAHDGPILIQGETFQQRNKAKVDIRSKNNRFFPCIPGLYNQNRAVNGDTVAIELFEKSKWNSASQLVAEQGSSDAGDVLEGDEEENGNKDEEDLQVGNIFIPRVFSRFFC